MLDLLPPTEARPEGVSDEFYGYRLNGRLSRGFPRVKSQLASRSIRDALPRFLLCETTAFSYVAPAIERLDERMADHPTPHFHNQPGVPIVYVGAHEFMCVGALPPFDHPHIFIDMGDEIEAVCPYCSTLFRYDASLHGGANPAGCVYSPEPAV